MTEAGLRSLKREAQDLLYSDRFEERLPQWLRFPARRIINPLFSFLCSSRDLIRWRAVTAMGFVVSRLADEDMESARVIMRRLIWNLNDESGGIGWGAPEAMGEIMASHEGLAREYVHILVSYIREDGNPLENEMLQRGVLWGLGRLARVRPDLVRDKAVHVVPFLQAGDPVLRGMAVWTLGAAGARSMGALIEPLLDDEAEVILYLDGRLVSCRIRELAAEAVMAVSSVVNSERMP